MSQNKSYWKNEATDLSLFDNDFLTAITTQKNREVFIRMTALDFNELPQEYIEGRATTGSINIDGSSIVRRTCSFTLVTNDIDIDSYYWGIKTKIKLEVGLKNNLTDQYGYITNNKNPDIVWFKQGVFIITSFNVQLNSNSYTISVQGKDKMCLLNGEIGGQLYSSIDFGTEEYKEKIITPVIVQIQNSTELETYKYYIDIDGLEDNEEIIYQGNSNYAFSKDETGSYYKDGNFYKKILSTNVVNSDIKYKLYQLVIQPDDFFILSDNGDFVKQDAIYYRKSDITQNNSVSSQIEEIDKKIQSLQEDFKLLYSSIGAKRTLLEEMSMINDFILKYKDVFSSSFYILNNSNEIVNIDFNSFYQNYLTYTNDYEERINNASTESVMQQITNNEDIQNLIENLGDYSINLKWLVKVNEYFYDKIDAAKDNLSNYYESNMLKILTYYDYIQDYLNNLFQYRFATIINQAIILPYHWYFESLDAEDLEDLTLWNEFLNELNDKENEQFGLRSFFFEDPNLLDKKLIDYTNSLSGLQYSEINNENLDQIKNTYISTNKSFLLFDKKTFKLVYDKELKELLIREVAFFQARGAGGPYYNKVFNLQNQLNNLTHSFYSYNDNEIDDINDNLNIIINDIHIKEIIKNYYQDGNISQELRVFIYNNEVEQIVNELEDYLRIVEKGFIILETNYLNILLQEINNYINSQEQLKDSLSQSTLILYNIKQLYTIDYVVYKKSLPIEHILRESIHTYANELYQNIIINDLDDYGLEQLTYKGDIPLYALRNMGTGIFSQILFLSQNEDLQNIVEESDFIEDSLTTLFTGISASRIWKFYDEITNTYSWQRINESQYDEIPINEQYTVVRISYGDDVGYRITDLTYNGDLISNVGESLTSILDKIKQMLGEFEYFYDIDGHFIFQKKRAYVDTYWSQLQTQKDDENSYITYANAAEQTFSFNFEDSRLITAFSNNPNIANLKNDFSVWGKRKSISGTEVPIHVRYAIDTKPQQYLAFNGILYCVNKNNLKESGNYYKIKEVDWREIIYQMALDYFAAQGCSEESPIYDLENNLVLNTLDLFLLEIGSRNPYYYPSGKTGYEQYYTDLQGFWRQLYNPEYVPNEVYSRGQYLETSENLTYWEPEALVDMNIEYYVPLFNEDNDQLNAVLEQYNLLNNSSIENKNVYLKYFIKENSDENIKKRKYWSINVFEHPEVLNFWFDFLDDDNELKYFSVPVVGDRSKSINDDKMKAVFYKEVPEVILNGTSTTETDESNLTESNMTGYTQINIPEDFIDYFTISYRGLTAKNKIDELIYQFAYCIENATISVIPIYYLQPNTRIYIQDEYTKINGEYIVSKITIPLTYNGVMQITATKAPMRLY